MESKPVFKRLYFWGEVIFFIAMFILSGPLSVLEFQLIEGHETRASIKGQIVDYLLYGISDLFPFGLFYMFAIKRLLFRRKALWLALAIPVFLVFLNYWKIFTYWLFSHLPFLPGSVIAEAGHFLQSGVPVHFSIIYVLRDLLALLALGLFIRTAEQDKTVSGLKRMQAEADLVQLQSQLHPHYFFNTLNSIYALSVKQSPLTPTIVAQHAEMMRYMLYEAKQEKVTLAAEVRFLEALTSIERIRLPANKEIVFDTQGVDETTLIEPLIMLPFVENAFKHGIQEEASAGYVRIAVCRIENELMLEVINSIPETPPLSQPAGIGLKNIRKRLALLYPARHELNLKPGGKEFRVSLTLKLNA